MDLLLESGDLLAVHLMDCMGEFGAPLTLGALARQRWILFELGRGFFTACGDDENDEGAAYGREESPALADGKTVRPTTQNAVNSVSEEICATDTWGRPRKPLPAAAHRFGHVQE
jgi:hypothetical protein